MNLTRDERRAILAGDHKALKRATKPPVKTGQKLVISWSRGGRQVVDRETGATIDIPRKPNVWIEFKEPELRSGKWVVQFIGHDERQPKRFLGAAPNPGFEPGLRTRHRPSTKTGTRYSDESARGYTGSARVAVDSLEGVGDEDLRAFGSQARRKHAEFQREEMQEDERRRRQRALRERLKETIRGLGPEGQVELMAAIEREIQSAARGTSAA